MLNKIIILNSKIYAKAVVRLDNVSSIQMVANNNTGKSSFVNTLNFLFIVDQKRMNFGDHDCKQTLNHYFPQPNSSYILFEVFAPRKGYYCILVKRNVEGDDIDYYIIEQEWAFLDTIFFSPDGELLKFQEVLKKLLPQGINLEAIEKEKLFEKIYSSERNNPVVTITNDVKRKGRSLENSFTRVYRYLINSKAIDKNTLKEALMTADNRQNETLTIFTDHSKKDDINKLKEHQKEIQVLKSIQLNFKKFKQLNTDYRQKRIDVSKMYYGFNELYQTQTKKMSEQIRDLEQEIEEINQKIEHDLEPQRQKLNQDIGGLKNQIKTFQYNLEKKQEEENEINQIVAEYGGIEFAESVLEQQIKDLESQITDITYNLEQIQKDNVLQEQVENKLNKLQTNRKNLQSKLDNYEDLIIYHLSTDAEAQRFFNTVFSAKISSFKKDRIIRPIIESSLDFNTIEFYGGQIDISGIAHNEIESIDDIKQELSQVDLKIIQNTEKLEFIKNIKSKEQNLKKIKNELNKLEDKINKIQKKSRIQEETKIIENEIKSFHVQKKDKENELFNNKQIIDHNRKSIVEKNITITNNNNCIKELTILDNKISQETENKGIEFINCSPEDIDQNIERLSEKLLENMSVLSRLKRDIDTQYNDLKHQLDSDIADIERFITEVDGKLTAIPDKEKSLETLLENISTQFTTPVKNFLQRYDDFKKFIKTFNRKISQYKVSNIEKIEIVLTDNSSLISDLELISHLKSIVYFNQMSLFDDHQEEALKKLNEYLQKSDYYEFERLFDISLILMINGEKAKRDLTKQVESEGTDKTLKLILFMLIIKGFVESDNDNKIVIFIDEVLKIDDNNMKELMRFCQQNHFLPICAAKSQAVGVEKFYFLVPSPKNNNKIFIDQEIQASIVTPNHV